MSGIWHYNFESGSRMEKYFGLSLVKGVEIEARIMLLYRW